MKIKKTIGIILVLCLFISAVFVPCFDVGAQISAQSYLDEQMEKNDINGVVYATKNGRVVCQNARGMANTSEAKEIAIDTLFPIGSNSKQFCAVAILMLQEQDMLNIDDPVTKYFPEYTTATDVTVKDLLTMRSGIRNHLEGLFAEYTLYEDATSEENKQTILEWLYAQKLEFKPNTGFSYSNSNYFLLSIIVEKVSGQSYAEFIKENIFAPLGMTDSGFYEELTDHPGLAEHTGSSDMLIDPKLKGLIQGSGDLVSNAKDMDKWMTSLRECRIISEKSIAEMTKNYSQRNGYGYGIRVQEDGGFCHDGAIVTYLSFVLTYPEDGFNIFAVTNDIGNKGNILVNLVFETAEKYKSIEIPGGICGDVNCDSRVNIKDATAIQKHIAGLITLADEGIAVADVDASGVVNVKDATVIQKYIAGIDTGFLLG